jgi:RNA polymerase sigma factor (sigma-70 family)
LKDISSPVLSGIEKQGMFPMANSGKHYDFVPGQFPDEFLVIMAQLGCGLAAQELMSRYYGLLKRQITVMARKRGLPQAEIPDVRQEAEVWVWEAIQHYDTSHLSQPDSRSFRAYLNWLIPRRFSNYVRRFRRSEKHLLRSLEANRAISSATGSGWEARFRTNLDDPVSAAQEKEWQEIWKKAWEQLDGKDREIGELLLQGKKLTWLQASLPISLPTVKRRKKKLLDNLKAKLSSL